MTDGGNRGYQPPKMAPWKPPVMLAILAALVVGIIAVSRATGDRGETPQTLAVWAMVVAAFTLVVFVSAVGAVGRPLLRTALVMMAVGLVCIAPLVMVGATETYRHLVVRPVCEKLETDTTRFDRVSSTADGFTSISRYFTRRLVCHYRTADAAVPEGIPTEVDLTDERLAGGNAWLYRWFHQIAAITGFVLGLVLPFPLWRWWFRSMMGEARRDREERSVAAGDGDADPTLTV
jgi:hypothetical protein